MDYFKQIFLKLLEYLQIQGEDAAKLTDGFLEQVNSKFLEEYLSKKLPKEQFDAKVEEYKKALEENRLQDIQADLKTQLQNPQEIGETYANAFNSHIQAFIVGLYQEGEIKESQFKEIEELLKSTAKNVNLQYRVNVSQQSGKIEDVLKNIAS